MNLLKIKKKIIQWYKTNQNYSVIIGFVAILSLSIKVWNTLSTQIQNSGWQYSSFTLLDWFAIIGSLLLLFLIINSFKITNTTTWTKKEIALQKPYEG